MDDRKSILEGQYVPPKSCPFCGENDIDMDCIREAVFMFCRKCGAEGPYLHLGVQQEAIAKWNTRAEVS